MYLNRDKKENGKYGIFYFVYIMQTEKGTDIDTQIKLKYIFDPKEIDRVYV